MDFAQKSEAILKFWTSIHKNTDNAKNLEELRNKYSNLHSVSRLGVIMPLVL